MLRAIYITSYRKANIINFAENTAPFLADVGVNTQRRRADEPAPTFVQDIGDLSIYTGLEEYDVSKFNLVTKIGLLKIGSGGEFFFYKKSRQIDWKDENFTEKFPADAIFKDGKWIKPLGK